MGKESQDFLDIRNSEEFRTIAETNRQEEETIDAERLAIATNPENLVLYERYHQMKNQDLDTAEDAGDFLHLETLFAQFSLRGVYFGGLTVDLNPDTNALKRREFEPNLHETIKTPEGVLLPVFDAKVNIVTPGVEILSSKYRAVILARKAEVIPFYM